MNDEQLNAILHKADDDLDRLKDKCHELYEENERQSKTLADYKQRIDKAIELLESVYVLDNVTITNNACDKIDNAINLLQNGSEK